ncbi:interleukin-8-like [Discoglossus pictus]
MCTKIISVALFFCLLYTTVSEARIRIELRCQCLQTHSSFIPLREIKSVELIPAGPNCEIVEVILTKKSGVLVCLDPNAPWVQKIINRLLESNSNTSNF